MKSPRCTGFLGQELIYTSRHVYIYSSQQKGVRGSVKLRHSTLYTKVTPVCNCTYKQTASRRPHWSGVKNGGHSRFPSIDEDNDDESMICRKMKSLSQIQDILKVEPIKDEQHTTQPIPNKDEDKSQLCEVKEEEEEEEGEKPRPIGDLVRVSQEAGEAKKHFRAFELDGVRFHLEDPVLVSPEEGKEKPSIVIIKDIFQTEDGELMVSGQKFYRPEEAEKERGGGTWQRRDPRELFYSHHLDDHPADTVMHRCIIHLVRGPKPLPNRKQHPGFVVRKVYDPVHRKLRELADGDCQGSLIIKGIEASG